MNFTRRSWFGLAAMPAVASTVDNPRRRKNVYDPDGPFAVLAVSHKQVVNDGVPVLPKSVVMVECSKLSEQDVMLYVLYHPSFPSTPEMGQYRRFGYDELLNWINTHDVHDTREISPAK